MVRVCALAGGGGAGGGGAGVRVFPSKGCQDRDVTTSGPKPVGGLTTKTRLQKIFLSNNR